LSRLPLLPLLPRRMRRNEGNSYETLIHRAQDLQGLSFPLSPPLRPRPSRPSSARGAVLTRPARRTPSLPSGVKGSAGGHRRSVLAGGSVSRHPPRPFQGLL